MESFDGAVAEIFAVFGFERGGRTCPNFVKELKLRRCLETLLMEQELRFTARQAEEREKLQQERLACSQSLQLRSLFSKKLLEEEREKRRKSEAALEECRGQLAALVAANEETEENSGRDTSDEASSDSIGRTAGNQKTIAPIKLAEAERCDEVFTSARSRHFSRAPDDVVASKSRSSKSEVEDSGSSESRSSSEDDKLARPRTLDVDNDLHLSILSLAISPSSASNCSLISASLSPSSDVAGRLASEVTEEIFRCYARPPASAEKNHDFRAEAPCTPYCRIPAPSPSPPRTPFLDSPAIAFARFVDSFMR